MPLLSAENFFQVCWVVSDRDAAAERWIDLGVGPFFVADFDSSFEGANVIHRGGPGVLRTRVALSHIGGSNLELIEPFGDGPSVYREFVSKGETRFHHFAYWTDDFEADSCAMNKAGFETVTYRPEGELRFAYFDATKVHGCIFELVERGPIEKTLSRVAEIAAEWDGRDPIRSLGELE